MLTKAGWWVRISKGSFFTQAPQRTADIVQKSGAHDVNISQPDVFSDEKEALRIAEIYILNQIKQANDALAIPNLNPDQEAKWLHRLEWAEKGLQICQQAKV